jgi:hypothetical protein
MHILEILISFYLNTDKLSSLDPDFTIKGFIYTFNNSIPNLNRIDAIISDYNSDLSEIDKKTKADIIKEKQEFTLPEHMNKIRAEILGVSGGIESENFSKETRRIYRDDKEEEIDITVNGSYLASIINGYPNMKKLYNDASKEKDRVIILIENMKSFFEKNGSIYYKNNNKTIGMSYINGKNKNENNVVKGEKVEKGYDINSLDKINTFFNFKYQQSKDIGNLCIVAITEKVNAIKEALKLHRIIIRKSLFGNKEVEA